MFLIAIGTVFIILYVILIITKNNKNDPSGCIDDTKSCKIGSGLGCCNNSICRTCPGGDTGLVCGGKCHTDPPIPTPSDLPVPIKGYYLWSWTRHATDPPVTGPKGSNIGITFPGAKASGANGAWLDALKNPPQTKNKLNLLSIGGGKGDDGEQSFDHADIAKTIELIPKIKELGYHGICFDLESGNASVDEYKTMLQTTKEAGLISMVTLSYFATNEVHGGLGTIVNELVQTLFTNPAYVDILSPQLYSDNCDDTTNWVAKNGPQDPGLGGGDFNGNGPTNPTRDAYRNCKFLAPTINSKDWEPVKSRWLEIGLPDPVGYFQYCNKYSL